MSTSRYALIAEDGKTVENVVIGDELYVEQLEGWGRVLVLLDETTAVQPCDLWHGGQKFSRPKPEQEGSETENEPGER